MNRIAAAAVLASSIFAAGCGLSSGTCPWQPPLYRADATYATIHDASTGRPLPGVIVVAHWQIEEEPSGSALRQIEILETTTDEAGRFTLPGWGPRWRGIYGVLRYNDPELLFFKPGYQFLTASNVTTLKPECRRYTHNSRWNGRTILMTPLDELERQIESHVQAEQAIIFAVDERCYWKHMPMLLLALSDEAERLVEVTGPRSAMKGYVMSQRSKANRFYEQQCGNMEATLRGVQK